MLVWTLCFFESFSQTAPYKVVSFWFGFAWECEPMWTDWLVECCWIRCCLGWCGFEFLVIWFHYFPKPSLQWQLPVRRWTFGPFLHHGVVSQSFRKNKIKIYIGLGQCSLNIFPHSRVHCTGNLYSSWMADVIHYVNRCHPTDTLWHGVYYMCTTWNFGYIPVLQSKGPDDRGDSKTAQVWLHSLSSLTHCQPMVDDMI